MQWCMQGVYKIYPTPIDKRTPVLVQVETSHCGVNAKYSSRPIIVPPVGTDCPMRWDNQSQRMGRFVFRIFVYDNLHTAVCDPEGVRIFVYDYPHTALCDPFSVSCGYMRIIIFCIATERLSLWLHTPPTPLPTPLFSLIIRLLHAGICSVCYF